MEIENYAAEDQILKLMSREFGLKDIHYIFTKDEVRERYHGLAFECSYILDSTKRKLSIRANITFVLYVSPNPFRVVQIERNDFAILIDTRACGGLLSLCFRLQTLEPLNTLTGSPLLNEARDFEEKFLVDIAREMVFKPTDLNISNTTNQERIVFRSALRFIISHEIAHIAHGHLEFKKSLGYLRF